METVYYNGDFCSREELKIPLSDRSIFFGDGIYDAAVGRGGGIHLEKEHIERFLSNAKRMGITSPLDGEELSSLLHKLIELNGYTEYFIYLQLSAYSKERRHEARDKERSNLLITVKEHTLPDPKKYLRLRSTPDIRYYMCDVKTLNLLPSVLASEASFNSGYNETLFVRGETVTECAHSNVFIVKNGILKTHPKSNLILPGVTRERLIKIARSLGVETVESPFTLKEALEADEVLITATGKLCLGVSHIDGKELSLSGNIGEVLKRELMRDYESCVPRG